MSFFGKDKQRFKGGKLAVLLLLLIALSPLGIKAHESSALDQSSATNEPRTVLDFYKLLPSKYLNLPQGAKTRKPRTDVTDIANGYLSLLPPANDSEGMWDSWAGAEVVLFKKKSGGYVVGVAQTETVTVSTTNLRFLEYSASAWRDVTKQVSPTITEKMIRAALHRADPAEAKDLRSNDPMFVTYDLPRVGRSIVAKWDGNATLFKLNWNGERFEMQ